MEIRLTLSNRITNNFDITHLMHLLNKESIREYKLNSILDNKNSSMLLTSKHLRSGVLYGCIYEENSPFDISLNLVTHNVNSIDVTYNTPDMAKINYINITILKTHCGKMLQAMNDAGIKLYAIPKILPNMKIITFDITY